MENFMYKFFKYLVKCHHYGKKILNFIICILSLYFFVLVVSHLTVFARPDAVIFDLKRLRVQDCLITIFLLAGLFYFPIFILAWISEIFEFQIDEKYLDDFSLIAIIISTILGLLITQTKEQFEFTATLISFVLIFGALFPKEVLSILSDAVQKLVQKRHSNENKK